MFGLKKRIWTKQLRRAATIENCLKAGILDHLIASHGYDAGDNKPSNAELALFGGAVNYIVAWDIQKQLQMLQGSPDGAETILAMARQTLASDPDLERLVIRVLYEIASLGHLLEREDWARKFLHNHPRIMDVLTVARPEHPELFRDVEETEFKALFDRFMEKYLPDMQDTAGSLFN
jgi:hypothetical protein